MSVDIKNLVSQIGLSNETKATNFNNSDVENSIDDILDLSKINFDDDETWLYESTQSSKRNSSASKNISFQTDLMNGRGNATATDKSSRESYFKNINTQTFTRPKKNISRPSIESYNQELFDDFKEQMNRSNSPESFTPLNRTLTKDSPHTKPLEFDLSQSMNSHYFDKIAAKAEIEDTFQNMSPPSLVNSLCSSTFTNLMESSFIKNDPLLKQICDTDFSISILSQGSEPSSLIQSLSYSTNSVDDFLIKASQDDAMKFTEFNTSDLKCSGDASFIIHRKDSCEDKKNPSIMDFEEYHDASDANFTERQTHNFHNGTYRKNNRLSSATFRKTDFNRSSMGRNNTYEIDAKDVELAQTVVLGKESPKSTKQKPVRDRDESLKSNSMENLKNNMILKDSCNNDLSRYDSKENEDMDCSSSKKGSMKSLDCSIGSADSLDRMSTLSSSSKGSNKMLNMEEVEAIAEKQEQSLRVMSTPKSNWSSKMLSRVMWDHSNIISPIITTDLHSDSGESSDEYKSVKSTLSKNSIDSNPVKQTRSLVSLQDPGDARKLRSLNTLVHQEKMFTAVPRGSTNSLQKTVPKFAQTKVPYVGPNTTNLKTMKTSLKGSYTSLKPVNTHLPVAPPINAPSGSQQTTYLAPINTNTGSEDVQNNRNDITTTKIAGDGVFIKPNGPVRSGLPRPTSSTSIPRPVSKIPGPKRFTMQKPNQTRTGT